MHCTTDIVTGIIYAAEKPFVIIAKVVRIMTYYILFLSGNVKYTHINSISSFT